MRISTLSLRVVTAIVLTTISRADGAPPNQPSIAAGRTAVIDLGHIFDNSTSVKIEVEKIRRDADAATKRFQKIQGDLQGMVEELKKFNKGSAEYARKEAAIVQKKADAAVQAQLMKKQLRDRRSKIYFAAYQQVEELVRLYSQNNGITLVLRSTAKPAEAPQTAAQRMQRIQRPVVFEQNVDITRPILDERTRRAVKLSLNSPQPSQRNVSSFELPWEGLY